MGSTGCPSPRPMGAASRGPRTAPAAARDRFFSPTGITTRRWQRSPPRPFAG